MKKTLVFLLMFCQVSVFAQALDPVKSYAEEVGKVNDFSVLYKLASETLEAKNYANHEVILQRMIELRPANPEFKFALAKAYALQDKKPEAYNELINLQSSGLSYPVGDNKDFDLIRGTKAFDYIEENMVDNANHYGDGKTAFKVSQHYSGMLFENMAYDQKESRFLLGSIRSGAIYQYVENQGFKEFIKAADPASGPWGTIDLVADNESDILWVASATLPHYIGTTQANFGQAMIAKYKLSTGELVNSFAMQNANQPMLFSAMHLTADQNLYFINAFTSDVFMIKKDGSQVEPVISLPKLNTIKALSSNDKETILYVSDFEQGIFVINLETKQIVPLDRKGTMFMIGINDMFYEDGDLVVIQSGISPARLMRYVLEQDVIIKTMFPIEASHESFDSLGNGVLVNGQVYYAANSQWDKTDPLGQLLPGHNWDPLVIMKSDSKYRMEEFMLQQQKMEEIKKRRGLK